MHSTEAETVPDGNFEIHVAQKKSFAPDIILNMCIYTDCKITTLSNSITCFLMVRKKNWYHRPIRREPPPFPLKWCLLFLPSLSFLLFAYGYSIFSIFFFVHFLDCCMSHTYGLKSCCRTEAILSDCEDVSVGHICTTDHLNHVPLNKSLYAYLGIRRKFDWNLTSWTGIIEQHALVHNFLYILNVN